MDADTSAMNRFSNIIRENIAVIFTVIAVGLLALFVIAAVQVSRENSKDHAARVVGGSYLEAETFATVERGPSKVRRWRAEVHSFPAQYWLEVKRDRRFAKDTYTIEVDQATYDRAREGSIIQNPHRVNRGYDVVAYGEYWRRSQRMDACDDGYLLARQNRVEFRSTDLNC